MPYASAPSLIRLRDALDATWPNRDRTDDGWIGDASHAATGAPENGGSDHNINQRGLVDARDIDKDGIHVPSVLACLITHPATHYVIHNRRIYSTSRSMRPAVYTGDNPHLGHIHESIFQTVSAEQNGWAWDFRPNFGTLSMGLTTQSGTRWLQAILNAYGASLVVDGAWGPLTDAALRTYQRTRNVANSVVNGNGDGIVGPMTRAALLGL